MDFQERSDQALIVPAGNAGKLATLQFIRADGVRSNSRTVRSGRSLYSRTADGRGNHHHRGRLRYRRQYPRSNRVAGGGRVRRGKSGNHCSQDPPRSSRSKNYLAGDNDIRPAGSQLENTGVVAARKASLLSGATVAIPELAGKKCDWNDVAVALGRERGSPAIQTDSV